MKHLSVKNLSPWVRPLGRIERPEQIAFKSRYQGPLEAATARQRGLLLCELCEVTYLYQTPRPFAEPMLGFRNTQVVHHDGAWSARYENEHDVIFVFRAAEPADWLKFVAEQKLRWADAEGLGLVLHGLKPAADALWPVWESALVGDEWRKVWFAGHSLGGALALVSANRCLVSPVHVEPSEVHTYGAPRVGNRLYRRHARVAHLRWVRDTDPIPLLPPAWSGFLHVGRETRLNLAGRPIELSFWDRLMTLVEEVQLSMRRKQAKSWPLGEHHMAAYVETLWEAILREEESTK